MICQNCEKENKNGAKFCVYCGAKFSVAVAAAFVAPAKPDLKTANVQKSGYGKKIAIIALLIALVGVGVWGYCKYRSQSKPPEVSKLLVVDEEEQPDVNSAAENVSGSNEGPAGQDYSETILAECVGETCPVADTADSAVEDAGIVLIKQYYLAITAGDLESAYNMYGAKRPSWANYQEWYKTAMSAVPVGFEKTKENNYRFEVAYSDSQSGEARYLVVMEVVDGKINPISSVNVSGN